MRTLLLNTWMAPHKIISWKRAVVLVVLGKVDVLEEYDEEIRSRSFSLRTPAVLRLKRGGATRKPSVRFSRLNVYTRDGFRCQYCGEARPVRELNYRKGGRSPEEAGMRLRKKPIEPKSLPVAPVVGVTPSEMPPAWLPYCSRTVVTGGAT
jgi:hypothetical protein